MKTVRIGTFETNSSSQHVFTTINKNLFEKCSDYSWDKQVFYIHPDGDNYGEAGYRKDCTVEIMPIEDAYHLYCTKLREHNKIHKEFEITGPEPQTFDEFEDELDHGFLTASSIIGKFMSYTELLHSIKLPEQITLDITWQD